MKIDVVLLEPEIPQNTGNIARTCVAAGAALHLIEPLGFSLDDRQVKRAGLDYWFDLDVHLWSSMEHFLQKISPKLHSGAGIYYVTTKAPRAYSSIKYPQHTVLLLGKESKGLPEPLLAAHQERCIRIPMLPHKRSLNLANAAAVVVYEVLRQHDFPGLVQSGQLDLQ